MNLPVTSRNWCDGADTATVSSVRIVPGPMGTGDWVVVANMTEPFVSLDVWFGADEDVIFGGAGDDVDTANWDVYGQVRQWDESNEQWYGATASVYGNNGDSTFAAGEDLEMFVVMSGDNSVNDKPCIEVGYTGAWSEGGMGQIPFVSDDFCHPARSASEFVGDQDPGAGYGPNRLWLAYDEMTSLWSVNGTWDARFNNAYVSVGSFSSMESMG
jgi:Ca2+-binding RTX toxin-like protein